MGDPVTPPEKQTTYDLLGLKVPSNAEPTPGNQAVPWSYSPGGLVPPQLGGPGSAGAPPPADDQDPELLPPPPSAGGGTVTDPALNSVTGGMTAEELLSHITNSRLGARPADNTTVMKEGRNFNPEGGLDEFTKTYETDPALLQQAFADSAKAQSDRAIALSGHYQKTKQSDEEKVAAMMAQRQQDADEIKNRQAQLEQATTYYSNDLANQGKFWQNPGNIVSAIAFSLMPVWGGDPAMGAKLINQAIDRDMANRTRLADMHLGELRSNIGSYRKLAEDRQAGDMLALSEAHRIAAMDVERIMQQFQSPIAKANGMAVIQDLNLKSQKEKVAALARMYNAPRFTDKRLMGGLAKGHPGDYAPIGAETGTPATNPATLPKMAVQGTIAGTPSTANDKGPTVKLSARDIAMFSSPEQTLKAAVEKRLPGGMSEADALQHVVAVRAAVQSKLGYIPGPGDPINPTFEDKKDEIVHGAVKSLETKAEPLAKIAQSKNVIGRLQQEMGVIENSVADPNKFIGQIRNWTPDRFSSWYQSTLAKNQGEPNSPAAKRDRAVAEAARHFNQLKDMATNQYIKENAGSAVSSTEEGRVGQVINGGADWHQLKGFVSARGGAINDEEDTILGTVPAIASLYYRVNKGILPGTAVATPGTEAPRPNYTEPGPPIPTGTGPRKFSQVKPKGP